MRSDIRALALLTFLLSSCVANTGSESTPSPSTTTPTSTATVVASSSLTPRPAAPMTAHENPFLGYRIALPSTYRRLPSSYFTADKTTGGLLGKIVELGDKVVTLEIAPNVRVRVERAQISALSSYSKAAKASS